MRVAYWGMGLYMGVGRTQNRAREVINDVRDSAGSYKDSADVVALLCRRTAKEGGTSKVMSSIALQDHIDEFCPDSLPVLESNNWFYPFVEI
ncbi:Taurine catabolism dioxygenase TauD/TfdA [Penicillium paradoxum]|uniref:Taurine catabolism dioxygenase TauD/TfdA n=1 Tax=Penicillium paradoxum TaxID=176176 RepID=UPI002547C169|nr:Taurine catabolism dioxygenase TauD/TfdA [Penicillium paradoxum]KAJ5773638.1 Taurine catabolism dioxygenase TauD/TfdA [Penicillium paradoxum]